MPAAQSAAPQNVTPASPSGGAVVAPGVPTYPLTCPGCGKQLTPVVAGPETAPWLCFDCSQGFWPSELSTAARDAYRPQFRDFGHGTPARDLHAARQADAAAAQANGTSALPEMLATFPLPFLQKFAGNAGLSKQFAAHVAQAIASKGGSK